MNKVSLSSVTFGLCMLLVAFGISAMQKTKEQVKDSSTFVSWPIISAVLKAQDLLGGNRAPLASVNSEQRLFLAEYFSKYKELQRFSEEELHAWASIYYEELNEVLAKAGFSIRLDPFSPLEGFGVVSILNVLVTWLHPGEQTTLQAHDGKKYPAARVEKGVTVYKTDKYTIVKIKTNTDDTAWLTIADEALEGFALDKRIKDIQAAIAKKKTKSADGTVIFPMVDLNQVVNINWLLRMVIGDKTISQAKQQTKLRMNHLGARVESAAAIVVTKSMPPRKELVVINRPFYLWIERPGLSHPIFVGYITENDWKAPTGLEVSNNQPDESDSNSHSTQSDSSPEVTESSESPTSDELSDESSDESSADNSDNSDAKEKKKAQRAEAKKLAHDKKRADKQEAEERKTKNKEDLKAEREKIKTKFKASKKASKQAKALEKLNAYIAKFQAQKAKELAKREKEYKKAFAELEKKHAKENAERDSYYAKWQEAFDAKKEELDGN